MLMSNRTTQNPRFFQWTAAFLVGCVLTACDMLESHPYDTRVTGETHINAKNCARIEAALKGRTSFRFAFLTDTQRWYDATVDAVDDIRRRNDIDFVLHGGDQSDFGVTKEFLWMRDILNRLDVPYVCVIGNHDCLGTGKDVFRTVYGDTNFGFTAGDMRLVCLNTVALEYDYSEPIPDFDFLVKEQQRMRQDSLKRCVFLMHAAPKSDVFNNNVATVFQHYLYDFPGVLFCLHGHTHALSVTDIFGDGTLYYQCPNIDKRKYLVFTIHEEGYDYEVVEF